MRPSTRFPARVAFITARSALWGERLAMDPGLGRFVDGLAARFESMEIACVPNTQDASVYTHRLEAQNIKTHALPQMFGVKDGFGKSVQTHRIIADIESRTDVCYVQLPFASPMALYGKRRPRVYHFCADIKESVHQGNAYRGWQGFAARRLADFIEAEYSYLLSQRQTRFVSNGEALWSKYGKSRGRPVISATMHQAEVDSVKRERPSEGDEHQIIFVGYLRPEKGVNTLLDALELVWESEPRVSVKVVGPHVQTHSQTYAHIVSRCEKYVSEGKMEFVGHRSFGVELFSALANADMLVLPSLSEGTPRVLNEARAFRCPVIASEVGGVPSIIDHNKDGLLFPAGDASALAAHILRLITDQPFKNELIERGLERAKGSCIENYIDVVYDEITGLVSRNVSR